MTTISDTAEFVTATDLLNRADDGYRYELVGGQLVRDSPPGYDHATIVATLSFLLLTWSRRERTGTVSAGDPGFKLRSEPDTVRASDVAFVSSSRAPRGERPVGYWVGAPDVAVEIVSPNDRMVQVLDKVRDYLEAGAQQVWIIVPQARTLTIHRSIQDVTVLTAADTLIGDDPVEGLQLRVAEVFA
ncbi:MAG: Uma2 family endonuclease [Gemmatimonadetes bacterium]|jgi:Uma2 family endonuclease|nr:Uma2 family endonuclease [Gemmatimonadota bacterium]